MAEVAVAVKIHAEPKKVWDVIGGFLTIDEWVPALKKCTPVYQGNDIIRDLELQDGGHVIEPLVTLDHHAMFYSYAIIGGVMPVENYTAKLQVLPDDNGKSSICHWTATFDPTAPEQEVVDLVANNVFRAALEAVKQRIEG